MTEEVTVVPEEKTYSQDNSVHMDDIVFCVKRGENGKPQFLVKTLDSMEFGGCMFELEHIFDRLKQQEIMSKILEQRENDKLKNKIAGGILNFARKK